MAPKYKLYFFADFPGRAEPSRLLFHYAGQQYEEVGILRENWPAEKSKFLYGQLPVLEVDGKQLAQSITIAKFLGKKFGLAGKDDWEEAKASEICDAINDCALEMTAYFMALGGVVPGDLDQLLDDVLLPALRKCLPLFSKLLAQSDSGFLLPSGLSYVDFVLAAFLNVVTKRTEAQEELGKQPPLVEFIARIYGLPKLRVFPTNANI